MFNLTVLYESKDKTEDVFIVNPKHRIEISANDLIDLLSQFIIQIALLQRKIYDEEIEDDPSF